MRDTLKKIASGIMCALLISGCASHYGAVAITSEPAGAKVINAEDGSIVGLTPLITHWKDSSSNRQYVALRIIKQGYEPSVSHFWLSMRHKTESSAKKTPQAVNVVLTKK